MKKVDKRKYICIIQYACCKGKIYSRGGAAMQRWLFGSRQSERETVLERRCHALHGCLRKAVHHHGALLDYIFHSALKEYRAYEKVRRNPDIGPGAQTLLESLHWQRTKQILRNMYQLGYKPEVLSFVKKEGLPRRILRP